MAMHANMASCRGPPRVVPVADATAAPARIAHDAIVASIAAVRNADQGVTRRRGQMTTCTNASNALRSSNVCRIGAADGRWLRRRSGHPIMSPMVRQSSINRTPGV